MSDTRRLVKKKRVNIRCARPFRIGLTPFSGFCQKVILNVEDIIQCIANKSFVEEVLKNGDTVKLNFSNYNTYNGPTDVDDDSIEITDVEDNKPNIEVVSRDSRGNVISVIQQSKPKEKREIRVLNHTSSASSDSDNMVVNNNKIQVKQDEKKTKVEIKNSNLTVNNNKEEKKPEEIVKDINSTVNIKEEEEKKIEIKEQIIDSSSNINIKNEEIIVDNNNEKEKNNNTKSDKKFDYNQQPSNFNKKKNKY